ncbi:helix-turn-helix domain-containing protein [Paracoccus sp. TK19116]|uniref:Helix-turn-helix domain-containing protein n=1 Tax=Paracoccus albicereus TaxID=2922394 RepID=A0ABT1MTD8_9RHOB|nr:helix-turn-helix transcriptional regulator [Paracoccus albicereus]MCQ0971570.1 helix-turn-helix domain-containing protein [Paracoccus albicereus]
MAENWYSDDKATLGDRIHAARDAAGLSVEKMARKLGLRAKTVSAWEHDEREPRANQLRMIAGLTGVSLIWLLTGEGNQPTTAGAETATGVDAGRETALTELRALQHALEDAARRIARLEQLIVRP